MRIGKTHLRLAATLCFALSLCAVGSSVARQDYQSVILSTESRALSGLAVLRIGQAGRFENVSFEARATETGRVLQFSCKGGLYFLQTDQLISAPIEVAPRRCETVAAVMLPRASVKAQIPSLDSDVPEIVDLYIHRCSGSKSEAWRYQFRRVSGDQFLADIPADCVDLTVVRPQMAPVRVPRFALTLGQVRDLGTIVFKPGAMVTARVMSEDNKPARGALVSLIKAEDEGAFLEALLAGTPTGAAAEGRTDADGTAQFTGVAPGLNYVVATRGERFGFDGPFELTSGTEAVIDSVRLLPRATVAVSTTGSIDWLAVGHHLEVLATPNIRGRWYPQAYVKTALAGAETTAAMTLPMTGRWRFELHAVADRSDALLSRLTSEVSDTGTTVDFRIERQIFRGRVFGQGRPGPGTLTLVREGTTFPVYRADVSESGEFEVALEGPDRYQVEFTSLDRSVVEARAASLFAPDSVTSVRLPMARVSGKVVTADGTPVSAVTVFAKPADLDDPSQVQRAPVATSTDVNGRFELAALTPGIWEFRATQGAKVAEPTLVTLADAYAVSDVNLVIETDSGLTGYALDERGQPLPGANGWAYVEPAQPGQIASVSQFATDMQGYFRIKLDRPIRSNVQLMLVAPGRPAAGYRISPSSERSASIVVPRLGGEVRIVLPHSDDTPNGLPNGWNLYVLVNEQGAALPLAGLLGLNAGTVVPTASSTTILLPSLAPGNWRLAKFLDYRSSLLYTAGVAHLPVLNQFVLGPQGKIILDLRPK